MSVEFLSEAAKAARNYDAQGYAQSELPQGEEVGDIKFYRCSLKAGCKVSPALDGEKFVVLIFNGKKGYITTNEEMFNITEPAFFWTNAKYPRFLFVRSDKTNRELLAFVKPF